MTDKKKIFNLILIPLKIFLILCMAYGIYSYFDKVFEIKDVDRSETLHSLPNDTIDVAVIGSSHAQYSFVPSIFYDETGLYSIVMGSPCQPLEVSYQMLREVFKKQSPKFVVLEAYTAMPLRKICEADVCYVKAQYMMTGEEKYNTIDYLPKEKALAYYNEFINNHNNWRYVEDLNIFKTNETETNGLDANMGYIEQEPILPVQNCWQANSYEDVLEVSLDELDLISLEAINSLCKENNAQLIMYKTPIDNIDLENYSYLKEVWNWCDNNEVIYLDFIKLQKEIGFSMVSHSDSYHCNILGANLITSKIGEYIKEEFIKNDYSIGHVYNETIENAYKKDLLNKTLNIYKYNRDVLNALKRIQNKDLTIILKYEPNNKVDENLSVILNEIGFKHNFDKREPYYAVLVNGNVILESNQEPLNTLIEGNEIYLDENLISINGEELTADGEMSMLLSNNDFSNYYLKNIDLKGKPWEKGYNYFVKAD